MGLFSKKNKKQGAAGAKNDAWANWTVCSDVAIGDVFDCPGSWFALQVIDNRLSTTTVDMCDQTGKVVKKEKRGCEKVLLKAIKKIPVRYSDPDNEKGYVDRWFPMPYCFEEGVYDARFAADYFCEGHWSDVWAEVGRKTRAVLPHKADASGNTLIDTLGVLYCRFPRERLDFLRGFAQGVVNHDRVMAALGSFEPRNGGYRTSGPGSVDLERCDFMLAPWMPGGWETIFDPELHAVTRQMYLDDDKPRTFEYHFTAEELENEEDIPF